MTNCVTNIDFQLDACNTCKEIMLDNLNGGTNRQPILSKLGNKYSMTESSEELFNVILNIYCDNHFSDKYGKFSDDMALIDRRVLKLLDVNEPPTYNLRVKSLISDLIEYAVYIAKLDCEMSKIDLGTRSGIYMGGMMAQSRRENLHSMSIYAINELNKMAVENLGYKIYDGVIDNDHIKVVTQAIVRFSFEVLEYV